MNKYFFNVHSKACCYVCQYFGLGKLRLHEDNRLPSIETDDSFVVVCLQGLDGSEKAAVASATEAAVHVSTAFT